MSNKIDKGFSLSYWKLSYRRKFFRTLWLTPVWMVVILLLFHKQSFEVVLILEIIIVVSSGVQLLYTYKKWQDEERARQKITDCF